MNTYEGLLSDLKKLGIQQKDVLLVHSSMNAIGETEGGAETMLDALMESVKDGMLVLPTHTWAYMTEHHNIFDRDTEPACVGILPNLFLKRKGVVRSYHPTHSVAAFGDGAEDYVSGEEIRNTPCSREGCYGKLYDKKAKILLAGCGLNRCTYMHGVEEWFGIGERLTKEQLPIQIQMSDGSFKDCLMHRHFKPDGVSVSEYYVKIQKPLMDKGMMHSGKIGNAESYLLDAKGSADLFTEYLELDRDAFLDYSELPQLVK